MKSVLRLTAILLAVSPMHAAMAAPSETIVLAGGCFWGIESVFEHVKGVSEAVVGYSGGESTTASYEKVSSGTTGHAESVKVTYDPQQVSLSRILDVYFRVAHDPTQLNYQGPDHGTQYRSAVFYATPQQQKAVLDKITELSALHVYTTPVVTALEQFKEFYPAEAYHQHYAERHPMNAYILINDAPKVYKLKSTYPDLYKG